ncbi:6-carboxytetrahydropterin synthase QueD [bacterium]|nr:6-carboxytetrahydropterin synthase QueD [bacterium]
MFEIQAESMFSAAHHLLNYNGECENQHGHNWKVIVSVRGSQLDKSNILVDFKILKKELNKVLDLIDHKDINELEYFKGQSPSSEMIAKFIYEKLLEKFDNMYSVAVYETPTSCAKYYGKDEE